MQAGTVLYFGRSITAQEKLVELSSGSFEAGGKRIGDFPGCACKVDRKRDRIRFSLLPRALPFQAAQQIFRGLEKPSITVYAIRFSPGPDLEAGRS